MSVFRIPASQFRSLPSPAGSSKLGFFAANICDIPPDLWSWREVNPREVSTKTSVYAAIRRTLQDEPDRFFERNRGLTILAKDVEFDDKKKAVVFTLANSALHGVVDGGHTLSTILEVQENCEEERSPASVFIKVMTGVDSEQVAEIAGGLNSSQQVDLKSLENLKGHFEHLQQVLADEPYSDKIAYKMNEPKPVDVREVLYYLAVFNCDEYNANKHPTQLFGRKEGLVRRFADEAAGRQEASFEILIKRAPEILRLRDLIEKKALNMPDIGRYKAGKDERVRSKKHRQNELHFLDETVNGKVPLGWIMPMLGAFRANVLWDQPKGSFSWRVKNETLLSTCLQRLVTSIQEVHERENRRPEHVGRSATAWRICYETVENAILQHELSKARAAR
jgi:hypothetical protein